MCPQANLNPGNDVSTDVFTSTSRSSFYLCAAVRVGYMSTSQSMLNSHKVNFSIIASSSKALDQFDRLPLIPTTSERENRKCRAS